MEKMSFEEIVDWGSKTYKISELWAAHKAGKHLYLLDTGNVNTDSVILDSDLHLFVNIPAHWELIPIEIRPLESIASNEFLFWVNDVTNESYTYADWYEIEEKIGILYETGDIFVLDFSIIYIDGGSCSEGVWSEDAKVKWDANESRCPEKWKKIFKRRSKWEEK